MFYRLNIRTTAPTEFVEITSRIQSLVNEQGIQDAICQIWVPHTTAGITVNEHADPTVVQDILKELNKVIPFEDNYQHLEGNSAAHIKSTLIGCSLNVIIRNAQLMLGTWQGIFFCEFDGPRNRQIWIKFLVDSPQTSPGSLKEQ